MGAAALDEATEGDVASANKAARTSVGHVVTVRSGGRGEARQAAADVAMRRLLGSPPLRTSPRGMPWGMLPRTRLPGGGEGAGRRDEAAAGKGKRGTAAADETTVRLKVDVSSVDEASRTTVWRTVTDETTAKRGSVGRRFACRSQNGRCGPRLCRNTRADGGGGWRRRRGRGKKGESGTGDRRRTRGRGTAAGCVASADEAASAERKGAGTCRRDSQGRLRASRCGRSREGGGGMGEPGLPPRRRPHDGRRRRRARCI